MADTTDSRWLKVSEAAATLRVDRKTVRRWLKAGRLPVRTVFTDRVLRLNREDFEAYMDGGATYPRKSASA